MAEIGDQPITDDSNFSEKCNDKTSQTLFDDCFPKPPATVVDQLQSPQNEVDDNSNNILTDILGSLGPSPYSPIYHKESEESANDRASDARQTASNFFKDVFSSWGPSLFSSIYAKKQGEEKSDKVGNL